MGRDVRDPGVTHAVQPQSAAPKPADFDAVDLHALRIEDANAVLGVAALASGADEAEVPHDQMIAPIGPQTAAVGSVDDRPSLPVRRHNNLLA